LSMGTIRPEYRQKDSHDPLTSHDVSFREEPDEDEDEEQDEEDDDKDEEDDGDDSGYSVVGCLVWV
jgi:hypothetical protein